MTAAVFSTSPRDFAIVGEVVALATNGHSTGIHDMAEKWPAHS
jgi:hypothetical protein